MNIKRGKSLIAFVLVIAMLLTMIPIRNRVMAAENGSITLEFAKDNGSYLSFNATNLDATTAPFYVVEAIVDGTKQSIALNASKSPTVTIYHEATTYYKKATVAQNYIIIEKGATLTEAKRPTSNEFPVAVENAKTFTLAEEFTVEKKADGSWGQKVPGSATLEFTQIDGSSTFHFNTILEEGELPKVNSSLYMVDVTIDGTTETTICLNAGSAPTLRIYSGYFTEVGATFPTKTLTIKAGALLQEATKVEKKPSAVPGGNKYYLSEEITVEKNTDGTWSKKEPGSATLEFTQIDGSSTFHFNTILEEGELPKVNSSLYMVDVTIDGTTETTICLNAGSAPTLRIYSGYFTEVGATFPTKTLTIKAGALLQEATKVEKKPSAVPGGNKYYLSEEITVEKNTDGTWSEQVTGNVTLEYTEKDASKNFIFRATVDEGVLPRVTNFYLAEASVDGREVQLPMLIQDNGRLAIRETFFTNELGIEVPTTSISFNEGAIFQVADRDASNKIVPVVAGAQYQLTQAFSIKKEEEHDLWYVDVATTNLGDMTMTFEYEDGSDNFYFVGEFAGETAPTTATYYKGVATIDGTTQYITLGINEEGLICIYKGYFTWKNTANNKVPTETFTIAEGTTFRQVYNVNGVWKDTMDNETPNSFTMANVVSLVNVDGCWDIDVETNNLGDLTMTFDHEDGSDNFYFVGKFADETALTSATYYKGVATIDGTTTQYITLGINAEGQICIYEGYFTWKNTANNKVPEKTFEIVAGTTFRQVYHDENGWRDVTDGETPNSFTMASHLSLVCIEDVWDVGPVMGDANGDGVMNTCDLVRYLKYNKDQANTTITTGADINGNSIYDDIDDLRKLLVGEDIPTATNFSLVQNGESDYTIVTPANATANEQVAANELQYFIKESTGATLSIASETDSLTADSGKYLYVGDTNAAEEASVILASSAQKKNGYLIKTIGDDCYLCGYSDIGTKNSVYEFLDHAFDYEYYAVDEIYLTKTSNVKLLDYNLEVTPDFEWRMAPNGEVIYAPDGKFATSASGEIANRMRFNLVYDSFVTGYDYHNSFTILPPATYQAEHPEWYSRDAAGEVIKNGTEPAQLCYSNEEMCTEFTQQLLSMLDSSTVENVMLGQQDTEKWCQCEECSAAYNKYGTNAAVLVKFANQVQAKVNAWFKENRTGETPTRMVIFAYQSTLKPPVIWDEESNSWIAIDNDAILNEDSSVMYAINDMQMHVPFEDTDPESLETPYGRLIGWDACSDSIYAWTYSLYMHHGLLFSNTIDVMAQNYSLLKKHGVSMIKEQADHYQRNKNSGFSRLETYLMSKMQWDTSLNQEELIDDFFNNYFGEAADTMQELFNGERQNILAKYSDSNLGFKGTFGEDVLTSNFWTESEVKEYQRLIEQAYDDIASIQTTNPTRYAKLCERIQLEAIQFDYIDCSLYSTDIETRNQFKNHFESLGLYSYAEHKSIGTLWKEWGIDCNQTMGFSEMSSDGKFNFYLHRGTKPGPYKTTAYIDGTDQEIEIQVAEDGYSASITLNTNPNNTLKISKGAILMPVNDDGVKDISRPIYKLEAELYISNSTGEWKAGNEISKEPTNMTMTFNYVSDKDEDGKYDFNFKVNGDIQTAFYKAYAEIDGEVKPVLLRSSDASRENQEIWIYEGFFNDNAKSADSILPQVTLIFKAGTVLTPVTDSTYTVNPDMGGYILEQDVTVTYDNGTWE